MAATVTKSPLMGKYATRLKKVIQEHAHDEPSVGFSRLPAGINNGVAQLIQCQIEVLKADTKAKTADGKPAVGECQLRLAAVCVEPESIIINGQEVKCAGLQTRPFPIPLFDTKTAAGKVISFEEHVQQAMDELKKLGAEFSDDGDASAMESLVAAVHEAKPYFKFRTSVKPAVKNPDGSEKYAEGTWENWDGVRGLESYTPPEGGGVTDNSGSAPKVKDEPTEAPADEYRDDMDVDSLLARAKDDDGEAQDRLNEMAVEASGKTMDEIQSLGSWEEVVEVINAGKQEEPADDTPTVEGVYMYNPKDAKGKPVLNKSKKPLMVEVEVKKIDVKKKVAHCVNNSDKKTKYEIKFDELVAA